MTDNLILVLSTFVGISTLVAIVALLVKKRPDPVAAGVEGIGRTRSADQRIGSRSGATSMPVSAADEEQGNVLGDRLVQAGLYRRNSVVFYMVAKAILMILPIVGAVMLSGAGLIRLGPALFYGVVTGIAGTIIPSVWLDIQKRKRQSALRRSLPDAVDVIVICVEAGLSLPAALVRVSKELATAHPMLATEMIIVHREIQIGYSTGEALRRFADRFDVEEIRSLSSVVQQAEKYGASIVKALRVHSESLRIKRFQRAEERARQAAVKLLIPTILFIFPALFVVILGPAIYEIWEMLIHMREQRI